MFPLRHWKDLWQKKLPNLQSTRNLASSTIFVAIDTEPWLDHKGEMLDDKEASKVGICFLFPGEDHHGEPSNPPRTLEETYQRFDISSNCLHIRGREDRSGEVFWKGANEGILTVEPDEVEGVIVGLLRAMQHCSYSPTGHPLTFTLVGFDLQAELHILAHQFPGILECFDFWVDIQELTNEATGFHMSPSPRNSFIACVFEAMNPTCTSRTDGHNAGNDAMRSICALVDLLFFPSDSELLAHTCEEYHVNPARERQRRQRENIDMKKCNLFSKHYPRPREQYPFQVKVDLPGVHFPGFPDAGALCEYFLKYKPVAAGSNSVNSFGGWICLASLEELNIFVREVNGMKDPERGKTWIATSQHVPGWVPATTAPELKQFPEQKLSSEMSEKRQIRQQRKEHKEYYAAYMERAEARDLLNKFRFPEDSPENLPYSGVSKASSWRSEFADGSTIFAFATSTQVARPWSAMLIPLGEGGKE